MGCVKGGFQEAVDALTDYRREVLLRPHRDNRECPVIFNDFMNCLMGDPTTEKELPLIDAASGVGCDYFVIDAGWYGEKDEPWWNMQGDWIPGKTRFPKGIDEVLAYIRDQGMVPGIWLEIEVAGTGSRLQHQPDDWFFTMHGKRIVDAHRFQLDFRNPEVRSHCDEVIRRVMDDFGAGYIKMDYNMDPRLGTDKYGLSPGQGLLEHQRAYLEWFDRIYEQNPALIIENCASGGCRMDYAMLSRHQIQSSSDQMDYRKYPKIFTGTLAAVLPEQLAVWSYPLSDGDADEASFNMVNAMLGRVHQSGHIANLPEESYRQVKEGIRVYKERIRRYIPESHPFFPLGMPDISDDTSPVAAGLKHPERDFMAVWCLEGSRRVELPKYQGKPAELLYPRDLGIKLENYHDRVVVAVPKSTHGSHPRSEEID